MGGIGPIGFILIILVALLLFGPSKLPELGRALGKTMREFKNGAKDLMDDEEKPQRKEVNASQESPRADSKDDNENRRLPE